VPELITYASADVSYLARIHGSTLLLSAGPTVTFPAAGCHCLLSSTSL